MRRIFAVLAVLVCASLAPRTAEALYRTNKVGDVDFGGRLRTTNLFRHSDVDRWAFIMQRNELKLRFEWKWLQRGKAFGMRRLEESLRDLMVAGDISQTVAMHNAEDPRVLEGGPTGAPETWSPRRFGGA